MVTVVVGGGKYCDSTAAIAFKQAHKRCGKFKGTDCACTNLVVLIYIVPYRRQNITLLPICRTYAPQFWPTQGWLYTTIWFMLHSCTHTCVLWYTVVYTCPRCGLSTYKQTGREQSRRVNRLAEGRPVCFFCACVELVFTIYDTITEYILSAP